MRIKKVLIQNFRSINYAEEVLLDREITILIGKNESGKTNFLKALEAFDVDYKFVDEDLCIYCEAKNELTLGNLDKSVIPIVTIWFLINEEDKTKLAEINEKLSRLKELKITKFFDGGYEVESSELDISALDSVATEPIKIEGLNSWAGIKSHIESLKTQLDSHAQRLPQFANSKLQYDQYLNDFLELGSKENSEDIEKAFNALVGNLNSLPNQDAPIQKTVTQTNNQITSLKEALKAELSERQGTEEGPTDRILELMPNFIYFTDVDLLQDSVPLTAFRANKDRYKTLANLLTLAKLDVDKLAKGSPYERRSATEMASAEITGLVNSFWKQQRVEVSVGIDGDNLIVFVTDDVGAFDPPSRRSKGFQWFLSFYVNFTVGSKSEFKDAILLLDDPGVFLHPLGQEDLKKALEQLSESNQLVLATHSPFMIYRDHLERIRIVDKESERRGTKLVEKYWVSDFDAIAPLRAALGVRLGEMPLAEKRHLIVEGYEDLLYLEAMALYFKRTKKKPIIDLSRMLILPVNGADKVPFYTIFLVKEGFKLLVLLDNDPKGRAVKKDIIESKLMPEDAVVTLDQAIALVESGRDYEIEDLFDADFYKLAVSKVYQREIDDGKVDLGNLDASIKKQTKRYKELFKGTKLTVDELRIAQQIRMVIDSESCDDKLLGEATLANFSKLFEIINERLK